MAFRVWQQTELVAFVEVAAIEEDIEHGLHRAGPLVAGMLALVCDGDGYGLDFGTGLAMAGEVMDWAYHGADKPQWLFDLHEHSKVLAQAAVCLDVVTLDTATRWGARLHAKPSPRAGEWIDVIEAEIADAEAWEGGCDAETITA